jgi:hypothetical protein
MFYVDIEIGLRKKRRTFSRQTPRGGVMRQITHEELTRHVRLLKVANEEDLDELLRDFLTKVYPTRAIQDS